MGDCGFLGFPGGRYRATRGAGGGWPPHRGVGGRGREEGRSAPDGAWVASGHGEAPVEVVQERGSEGERGLNGGDAGQVQLGGEPIVESSPEALNAAFGLGSAGRDVADADFLEGLGEAGGSLSPCELFFEGPVVVEAG